MLVTTSSEFSSTIPLKPVRKVARLDNISFRVFADVIMVVPCVVDTTDLAFLGRCQWALAALPVYAWKAKKDSILSCAVAVLYIQNDVQSANTVLVVNYWRTSRCIDLTVTCNAHRRASFVWYARVLAKTECA